MEDRAALPPVRLRLPPAAFKVNCPEGARESGLGHWLLCRRGQSNTVLYKNFYVFK